jgi:osmotically-inducible protein OsmY
MPKRTFAIASILGLVAVSGASAAASDDEVRNAGTCTESSSSKIKVKPDDGRIEVEFEVDQNKSGDKWKVKIKDNGEAVVKEVMTTRGPSGSFSLERKIADQAGSDEIVGKAKNKSTGERCTASATL